MLTMVYRLVYRTTNGDLLPVARVLHAETSNGDNVVCMLGVRPCNHANIEKSCEQSSIYATNSRYVDPQATPLPSAPIQHRYQTQSPARNQQPFAQLGTSSSLPLPATESLAVSMDSWFQGLPFNNDLPYYNHNNDLQSGHDASKLAQETSIYPASPLERRRSNAFGATNDPDLQLSATRQSYQGGQPISQAPLSQPALGWPAAARFPNQTPYSEVIWNCLKESPEYTCSLKDIYEYFTQHTDRDQLARQTAKGDDKVYKKERAGWQCSVRHNLSMNEVRAHHTGSQPPSASAAISSNSTLTIPGFRELGKRHVGPAPKLHQRHRVHHPLPQRQEITILLARRLKLRNDTRPPPSSWSQRRGGLAT